jgi:hypothetical protein
VQRFVEITREEVLARCGPRTCVLSTRTGLTVLRYFGERARPQAVRFAAFSPKAVVTLEIDPAAGVLGHSAGHSVGVSGTGIIDPVTGRWDGHLIIRLGRRPELVDLSLDQASRPDLDLPLAPTVAPLDESWDTPKGHCAVTRSDGSVLLYWPLAGPAVWRESPDWAGNHDVHRACAGAAIRRLRALTASPAARMGTS